MGNYQGIYQYIKKRTISYPKKLRVNIVLQRSVSNWNWYKKKKHGNNDLCARHVVLLKIY